MKWIVLVALAIACGSSPKRPTMSASAIASSSEQAIVTIRAGDERQTFGVVVDDSGLIATTLHPIEGESRIRVLLHGDPTEHPVTEIAGVDTTRDLALLRVGAPRKLPMVRLGDSDALPAGARLYEVDPSGVTEGTLHQVRQLNADLTILQVTAANAQDWLGPILDEHGAVVGLTAAYIGPQHVIAIPANELEKLLKRPPVSLSPEDFAKQTAKPASPR